MKPAVSDVFEILGSENPAALLKKWLNEASGQPAGGSGRKRGAKTQEKIQGKASSGPSKKLRRAAGGGSHTSSHAAFGGGALGEALGGESSRGEPWAAALSTADSRGRPSCRMVLVKEIRQKSSQPAELVFFTNYESGKGRDLSQNPHAALLFYWPALGRQIRVQGRARKISRQRSAAYWRSRSRGSRLSQTVSRQSASVAGRQALEDLWRRAEAQFRGREIPCPQHWGGYSLSIQRIEFWIDHPRRLHDRFLFEKKPRGGWSCRRLFP